MKLPRKLCKMCWKEFNPDFHLQPICRHCMSPDQRIEADAEKYLNEQFINNQKIPNTTEQSERVQKEMQWFLTGKYE